MFRAFICTLALFAGGCVNNPFQPFGTPTFTHAQTADLQNRAKEPRALGIELRASPQGIQIVGANQLHATQTSRAWLVEIIADSPTVPGGRYRVPVIRATVNGKPQVPVLLDSGSNRSFFGYSLARDLKIPIIAGLKPVPAAGIGGAVDSYTAVVQTLQIDSLEFRKLIVLVGPENQVLRIVRHVWEHSQVMLLGVNALKELSYVSIDYLHGTVEFSPHEPYRPDKSSSFVTSVPLRWEGDLPVVDITIGNRTYPCILDTGGDYGMLVPRSIAEQLGWTRLRSSLSPSRGVGGQSLAANYEIKQATVGRANLVGIPARTKVAGPEPAGGQLLLGNVALRRFHITFDFKNNTFWLEK